MQKKVCSVSLDSTEPANHLVHHFAGQPQLQEQLLGKDGASIAQTGQGIPLNKIQDALSVAITGKVESSPGQTVTAGKQHWVTAHVAVSATCWSLIGPLVTFWAIRLLVVPIRETIIEITLSGDKLRLGYIVRTVHWLRSILLTTHMRASEWMVRLKPLRYQAFAMMTGFLLSCRVNAPQTTLPADYYWISDKSNLKPTRHKEYVLDSGDSIRVINPVNDQRYTLPTTTGQQWSFRHAKLDVDVFTIPFKVRRTENGVPPQYDTDFNTAFYVGRRINRYTYQWKSITPTYAVRQLRGRGFGYGLFLGVGSTNVSNDVTRTPINISYQGVVLHAGVATIYDAGPFNFGLAVGMDHLIDPNRQYWIYQYKPWFGVLFGLNLN